MDNIQENNEQSIIRTMNSWKEYRYLLLACTAVYLLSKMGNAYIAGIGVIIFSIIGLGRNRFMPISIWICVYFLNITIPGNLQLLLWGISFIPLYKTKFYFKDFALFVVATVFFSLSYYLGVNSDRTSLFMQIFAVVSYIMIFSEVSDESTAKLIFSSFIIAAGIVTFDTLMTLVMNPQMLAGQRLTYNNSVRALANILTLPLYLFGYSICANNSIYQKYKKSVITGTVVFSILLLLTYSRGNIIALVIVLGLVSLYLLPQRFNRVLVLLVIVMVGVMMIAVTETVNIEFLTNSDTATARVDIWSFYIEKVISGGWKRIVFGYGPGDIRRLFSGEYLSRYYAHSTFFDYFFSYGLIGVSIVLTMVLFSIREISKYKSIFNRGLLFLVIIMFIPFGTCQHLGFHVLIALAGTSLLNYD